MKCVELIYDSRCPNTAGARANLLRAFAAARQPARWQEWERSSPDAPAYVSAFGSPTLLVNGRDVSGEPGGSGHASCRLYISPRTGQRSGVPDVLTIRRALSGEGRWIEHTALLPAVGLGLLPKIACPACWPAYAGVLSSLGLGFLLSTKYALPLTLISLVIAMLAMGATARQRRDWRPVWFGGLAAMVLIASKFLWNFAPVVYAATALLVIAAAWNTWPRRAAECCSGNTSKKGDECRWH